MTKLVSVNQISAKWQISPRSVRTYCAEGRIEGVVRKGKAYFVPENASKPCRKPKRLKAKSVSPEKCNLQNASTIFSTSVNITDNAERIRDVIRYIKRFKNATIVIHIDDRIVDSALFSSHISDIALMHETGLRVLIVPGAKKRIDDILTTSNIQWQEKNGLRITGQNAIPLIKMAAFDVSNKIMTSLSGYGLTALIGNWVRAREKGVIDGFDYCTCGEIDWVSVNDVQTILDNGFIPIFPCIGWSVNGKPYNISSVKLASYLATALKAEKLFFLTTNYSITKSDFCIPQDFPFSLDGCIPAMNLEELNIFMEANKSSTHPVMQLLKNAKDATSNGVKRAHILNGSIDGTMLSEIFSGLGSGTMIYKSDYGTIRLMQLDDVPRVLGIMRPFMEKGILLFRTEQTLSETHKNFIVYELDGGIRGCASLVRYDEENQAEIAAIAVDQTYSHMGIGPKMVSFLIEKAKSLGFKSVFVMTTQTSDWFEKLNFKASTIESLPKMRRAIWNKKRGSKVFRLEIE